MSWYSDLDTYDSGYTLKELEKNEYLLPKKKEQEKMISVDGKDYSESTVKKALKEYMG